MIPIAVLYPAVKGEAYAQDGRAAAPLAYSAMQRRFYSPYAGLQSYNGFLVIMTYLTHFTMVWYGYGYNGYNSYGYSPYFYTDDPMGMALLFQWEKRKRKFRRDRLQGTTTMLTPRALRGQTMTVAPALPSYTNTSISLLDLQDHIQAQALQALDLLFKIYWRKTRDSKKITFLTEKMKTLSSLFSFVFI